MRCVSPPLHLSFTNSYRLNSFVSCDRCQNWYHIACIGVAEEDIGLLDQYVCPVCEKGGYRARPRQCANEFADVDYGICLWYLIDPSVTLKTCYKDKCQREGCKRPGRGALSKYVALAFVTKYDG
jgi:hypothetical protein